jgi:activating signal cointegrator 1
MKVISLTQPWATLVVIGAKHYETRSWFTGHRGPLVIHASKNFPREERSLCLMHPFKTCLEIAGYTHGSIHLPTGALVGIVEMTDCQSTAYTFDDPKLSRYEKDFGDFGPGRYAWKFERPHQARNAITCAGKLGLWNLPDELLAALQAEVGDVRKS